MRVAQSFGDKGLQNLKSKALTIDSIGSTGISAIAGAIIKFAALAVGDVVKNASGAGVTGVIEKPSEGGTCACPGNDMCETVTMEALAIVNKQR